MEMTETMFVALISACSALIGAVSGAFAMIWASHHESKMRLHTTVVERRFDARYKSFLALIAAHTALVHEPTKPENVYEFRKAVEQACISASPETCAQLMILRESLVGGLPHDPSAYIDALISIQNDMEHFSIPTVEKSKWPKSLRK